MNYVGKGPTLSIILATKLSILLETLRPSFSPSTCSSSADVAEVEVSLPCFGFDPGSAVGDTVSNRVWVGADDAFIWSSDERPCDELLFLGEAGSGIVCVNHSSVMERTGCLYFACK